MNCADKQELDILTSQCTDFGEPDIMTTTFKAQTCLYFTFRQNWQIGKVKISIISIFHIILMSDIVHMVYMVWHPNY